MKIWNVIKYPLFLLIFGLIIGCSTIKEVPINNTEKIVYRDTTIFIKDTITVEIPKEVVKEIVPTDTVSVLKTSVAESEAKIHKGMLYHSLKQTGKVKAKVDTIVKVEYKDRYIHKEIPIEVKVEKKVIPNWAWWSLIANIVIVLLTAFRMYLRFKGV